MVKFWHDAIVKGIRKFSETPAKLKEAVRAMLIETGHESLIDE